MRVIDAEELENDIRSLQSAVYISMFAMDRKAYKCSVASLVYEFGRPCSSPPNPYA